MFDTFQDYIYIYIININIHNSSIKLNNWRRSWAEKYLCCCWSLLVFIAVSHPNIHPHKCAPSCTILCDDKARLPSPYLISAIKVSTRSSVKVPLRSIRGLEVHPSSSSKNKWTSLISKDNSGKTVTVTKTMIINDPHDEMWCVTRDVF